MWERMLTRCGIGGCEGGKQVSAGSGDPRITGACRNNPRRSRGLPVEFVAAFVVGTSARRVQARAPAGRETRGTAGTCGLCEAGVDCVPEVEAGGEGVDRSLLRELPVAVVADAQVFE